MTHDGARARHAGLDAFTFAVVKPHLEEPLAVARGGHTVYQAGGPRRHLRGGSELGCAYRTSLTSPVVCALAVYELLIETRSVDTHVRPLFRDSPCGVIRKIQSGTRI